MAILKVARLGHPVLRTVAAPVPVSEIRLPETQRLIDDTIETMGGPNGGGPAPPRGGGEGGGGLPPAPRPARPGPALQGGAAAGLRRGGGAGEPDRQGLL